MTRRWKRWQARMVVNWEFIHNFLFSNVMAIVETKVLALARVLTAIAVSPKKQDEMMGGHQKISKPTPFAKPIPTGSGNNRL